MPENIASNSSPICPQCHQPVAPTAYFCSNCGKKLNEPPFSTSVRTQAWIYAVAIILPSICFLGITRWPAFKYAKSPDTKTRQIGYVAIALMLISTLVTYWLIAIWISKMLDAAWGAAGSLQGI